MRFISRGLNRPFSAGCALAGASAALRVAAVCVLDGLLRVGYTGLWPVNNVSIFSERVLIYGVRRRRRRLTPFGRVGVAGAFWRCVFLILGFLLTL